MATFPRLDSSAKFYRTWQFQTSQIIAVQATQALTNGRCIRLAKEAMIGNGAWTDAAAVGTTATGNWTMESSSDGAGNFGNNDQVDWWTTDATAGTWANAGTNHSWAVLKQIGYAGNPYYLCIDLSNTTQYQITFVWSKNIFTGGTATARPTSVDEAITFSGVGSSILPGLPNGNVKSIMHVMKSADGKATRIIWARNGWSCGLWMMDELEYAPPGVIGPNVMVAYGDNTAAPTASRLITNYFGNTGNATFLTQVNGKPAPCMLTFWNSNNAAINFVTSPTTQNEMELAWPAYRMKVNTRYDTALNGVAATPVVGARGEQGILRDIWWIPSVIGEADMAPGGGGNHFVCFGDMLFPWDTTVPTMA